MSDATAALAGSSFCVDLCKSVRATHLSPKIAGKEGRAKKQLWRLYISHFLSTWNIRSYEFAAVSISAFTKTFLFDAY